MRLAALLAAALCATTGAAALPEDTVNTTYGLIQGMLNPLAREFRGIPYAVTPGGRWTPPVAPPAWAPATLNATANPPACPQVCTWAWGGCPTLQAEACLFVNVFTPRAAAVPAGAGLPVVVWIHGGDYIFGHIGSPMYNGSVWAATAGIVVMTIQYRLGALGTLYDGGAATGNYGLKDQQAAFAWARANAPAFGGDASRVTIVGQSAGAISVATQLVSPTGAGLFDAAAVHSDPFAIPLHTPASAVTLAGVYTSYAGCGSTPGTPAAAACLASASLADLMAAQVSAAADIMADVPYALLYAGLPWSPTTGTPELPAAPLAAFANASAYVADVPVMMGTVTDEVRGLLTAGFNMSGVDYSAAVLALFGVGHGLDILSHYAPPPPAPTNYFSEFCTVGTAGTFRCAVRNASLALAARPGRTSPTWLYHFNHVLSWAPSFWGPNGTACWGYVCHTSDILLLFQPEVPALNATYTAAEDALASAMQVYWGNFAAHGAPGSAGASTPVWPPLPPAGGVAAVPSLYLATTGIAVVNATFDGAECDWWDTTVGYNPY